MNLMHLRYFMKLAEIQNYTLAAQELYITQPGLSSAINQIEEELGIRLFEKKGRNVYLSKFGAEFYKYVDESLKILDTGISIAQEHSGKLNGTIEIGCIDTIISTYLTTVIHSFNEKYPRIQFKIHQAQTEPIMALMNSELCDIGLCSCNSAPPDMTAIPILTQETVAVVHKEHPLASRKSIVMKDLAEYTILTYTLEQQIGQWFSKLIQQKLPEKSHNTIRYEFPSELFAAGILFQEATSEMRPKSVGLLAKVPYIENRPELVQISIKDVPDDFRTIYMLYNNKDIKSPIIMLFVNFVKERYSLLS